ncbi:MAG TPA: protein kinase [Labilithrix sp.]
MSGERPTSSELEVTTLASRYHLLGLLGSGGMGTVYRARDAELDEIVALKVLRSDIADTRMVERFRREVKLARRVTHKNVARTYDIGEDAGVWFLTMEYIDGDPLSAALRAGPIDMERSIAVARDLCDGLAASHDAGVVHGDLKPENVICTSRGAVITDFGIARALATEPSDSRTGNLAGTPAYMAPEQVEGTADLDGRADLYALGCILFRLFTGQLPWVGKSYVAVAAARLLKAPPDPRSIAPDLPGPLAEIVLKCLAKEREGRWRDARELDDAIASVTTGCHPHAHRTPIAIAATKTVAVLPLANEGSADDAYIAASVGDELADLLSAVPRLRVRPRAATRSHGTTDPREAGRALGVDAVVTGSVGRHGDALRAKLRVVAVADGYQLWAQRFEEARANVLTLADDAATAIARVLVSEKVEAAREAPTDPAALDLYLRGRYVYARSFHEADEAIALLGEAHARAPNDGRIGGAYALALLRQEALFGTEPRALDRIRSLADALLGSSPSAEAHVARSVVHFEEGEMRSAALELTRALALDPRSADALERQGRFYLEGRRVAESIELFRRAREAEPQMSVVDASIARAHIFLGDWDLADEILAKSDAATALRWLSRARFALWRRDGAHAKALLAELERAADLDDASRTRAFALLRAAAGGSTKESDFLLLADALPRSNVPRRKAFREQIRAEVFVATGHVDRAREALGELADSAFFDLTWLDQCPLLESLRGVPELAALRRQTEPRVARALEVFDRPLGGAAP